MLKGILCGLAAGALWGLTFIVPKLVPGFGPIQTTVARYVFYGLISIAALLSTTPGVLRTLSAKLWRTVILLGLAGYVIYYALEVVAVRLVGVSLTSLIIGVLPVTIALTGRLTGESTPLKRLAVPLLLITGGIVVINADAFTAAAEGGGSLVSAAIGAACAFGSLALWTTFAVWNAMVLKANQNIPTTVWASLVGLGTLAGSILLMPLALLEPAAGTPEERLEFASFVLWAAVLGLGSSWVASWLWSIASRALPVSLTGLLLVSETLFALAYGFVLDGRGPRAMETIAIVLITAGVVLATTAYRPETATQT